ncbi:MAG: coproporphyrinogen dehydrogenase HemZ [Oscillospiraceae bacterium]|nr:coproporphyrinogen dehydrogenase HemZ [Oscillospiraceae bacterium]
MQIIINNHPFRYEMENIARMFFHEREIEIKFDIAEPSGDYVLTQICQNGEILVSVSASGRYAEECEKCRSCSEQETEWQMAGLLYDCLLKISGKEQKWGLLTGVRPTRLVHRMLDAGLAAQEIRQKFLSQYRVSEEKFLLVWQTAQAERPVLLESRPQDFSLYISIPFCPSRCNYCSFVSGSVEKFAGIIPQYVEYLAKEIEDAGNIAKTAGLRLKSVYFGGGTPTTLSTQQLAFLMGKIADSFDLSHIEEYTVEAGRPDTVTIEKLSAIKDMGADRISINPQTFSDNVLKAIGRRHTSKQTLDAFELAKKVGFKTINMDLIAGLTDDTLESFVNSLETAISLRPENITLHTLTVKRAANLAQMSESTFVKGETPAEKMVGMSRQRLFENGFFPYYMYRQKNTLSNLENVGYTLDGHKGYYNIYIMDEVHTILALGAGAVTKLKSPHSDDIRRVYNYKYPTEYLSGFENIINRKREVLKFYEQYPF